MGTGNVWRFPRVMAVTSSDSGSFINIHPTVQWNRDLILAGHMERKISSLNPIFILLSGSLTFLIAWVFFLFTWSIPLIITEYSIGRFTRSSPIVAFQRFMGDEFIWIGCWVTAVAFFIGLVFAVALRCLSYWWIRNLLWLNSERTFLWSLDGVFTTFTSPVCGQNCLAQSQRVYWSSTLSP